MSEPRPVVLVHGAWHGAWCWAPLQTALASLGVASYAPDLPGHGCSIDSLGGLHHDSNHLGDVLDRLALDRAVLVGHSYGGAVVTNASAQREDIDHLVYIAAFALDDGESVNGALRSFDRRTVALAGAVVADDDGTTTLDPAEAAGALYGSCSPAEIAAALPRLSPQPMSTMTEPVTGSPRDHIRSTYVRCLRDESVHPDHQRTMGERCSNMIDLDTDHSPFLSMTDRVAEIIAEIARS